MTDWSICWLVYSPGNHVYYAGRRYWFGPPKWTASNNKAAEFHTREHAEKVALEHDCVVLNILDLTEGISAYRP